MRDVHNSLYRNAKCSKLSALIWFSSFVICQYCYASKSAQSSIMYKTLRWSGQRSVPNKCVYSSCSPLSLPLIAFKALICNLDASGHRWLQYQMGDFRYNKLYYLRSAVLFGSINSVWPCKCAKDTESVKIIIKWIFIFNCNRFGGICALCVWLRVWNEIEQVLLLCAKHCSYAL